MDPDGSTCKLPLFQCQSSKVEKASWNVPAPLEFTNVGIQQLISWGLYVDQCLPVHAVSGFGENHGRRAASVVQ